MVEKSKVLSLWGEGRSAAEIASELGVSRARVYQIVKEARELGWYRVGRHGEYVVIATDAPDAVADIVLRALARAAKAGGA